MSGHDGPDISAVYQLLSEAARIVAGHDRRFDEHDRRFDAILSTAASSSSLLLCPLTTLISSSSLPVCSSNRRSCSSNRLRMASNRRSCSSKRTRPQIRRPFDRPGRIARDVDPYHASVLGHGILISELEERVRRIERHLYLEPASG